MVATNAVPEGTIKYGHLSGPICYWALEAVLPDWHGGLLTLINPTKDNKVFLKFAEPKL